MNVSLTPQLEALIQQKLAGGLYTSASEVVREALRLLEQRDRMRDARLDHLRHAVRIGLDQIDRGASIELDDDTLDELGRTIKANGRTRLNDTKRSA